MPQTQFIDRAVVLPGVLWGRTRSANRALRVCTWSRPGALSWPCELGADQVRVHGLADSVRDGVLLVFVCRCVIMQLVIQQSKSYVFCATFQFLDGVLGIPLVPQREIPQCSS